MNLLPFFGQENDSGMKPPDNKRRSKIVASSALGRNGLSKLSTLLILSMLASAASDDVLQQYPKRPDILEEHIFDSKAGAQIRNVVNDGRNMMTVSPYWFVLLECIA